MSLHRFIAPSVLVVSLLLTSACATDDGSFLDALRDHAAGQTPPETVPGTQTPPATAPGTQTPPATAPGTQTGTAPATQPAPTPAPTTPPAETTPVAGTVETIQIDGLNFIPNDLTVAPGTTVRWENQSGFAHTVTAGEPGEPTGLFEIQVLDAGGEGEFIFDEAGDFPYHSVDFPSMTGIVRVQ